MNISKKLNNWQSAGIISNEQALKIADYETQNTKPYLIYALVFVSILFIGFGTISIIAANWDAIHYTIKLIADFILLGACCYGVYYTYGKEKKIYFEALLFLFALLCLASIGLIAQIYQLQSDGPIAFLLWSSMMLPLTFFSKKVIFPFIALTTFFFSSAYYLDSYIYDLFMKWYVGVYITFSLLLIIAYQSMKLFIPDKAIGFCKCIKFYLITFLVIETFCADFDMYSFFGLYTGQYVKEFAVLLFVILSLTAITYFLGYLNKNNFFLPITISFIILASFIPLGFVVSIGVLSVLAYYAYNQKQVKLLNFAIFTIAARVFILYSKIFASLMTNGFGFIISGCVLLLLVFGWKKATKYFQRRLKNEN